MFRNYFWFSKHFRGINGHIRTDTTYRNNCEILQNAFGMEPYMAEIYTKRCLKKKDPNELVETIAVCRKLGYSDKVILSNPSLLSKCPHTIQMRYRTLEEGGFSNIDPKILFSRKTRLTNKAVSFLKQKNLIPKEVNVLECMMQHVKIKPKDVEQLEREDVAWIYVKKTFLREYLKLRLQATDEDMDKLFRVHMNCVIPSLSIIEENLEFAESVGMPKDKILKCGYILNTHGQNWKTTMKEFPLLIGIDIRTVMNRFPKIITTPTKNIHKIYKILKSYNVPDEAITRKLDVFVLSPETVKKRFEEIEAIPELRMFLKSKKVLNYIVYTKRVKERLSFLKQLKLKCTNSFILDTGYEDKFKNYIRAGKDINNKTDVTTFLQNTFGKDEPHMMQLLKRHPYYLRVSLLRMEETVMYLKEQKYTKPSILKAIHIILYPKEKIETAIKVLRHTKDLNFCSLPPSNQLNLIIYEIEKEHHFTGNGIWSNKDDQEAFEKSPENDIILSK